VQAFYEWKVADSGKQPYGIDVADTDLFAMAGIMGRWQDRSTGEVVDSVTVLTCEPNTLMKTIHHRMPVILDPEAWEAWLDHGGARIENLAPLLVPYSSQAMRAWPVSNVVNKVVNDGPELLDRVRIMRQGSLF
jgi:putative SOS response-associated peptidase YedK